MDASPLGTDGFARPLLTALPPFELHDDSCDRTSLDALETGLPTPVDESYEDVQAASAMSSNFRHSGWRNWRLRIYDALKRIGTDHVVLHRFQSCGDWCTAWRDPERPERYQVRGNFCRHRYCLPCATNRARIIATNLHAQLETCTARFLTLTLKHEREPLADQIDRLYEAFARLRRRGLWLRNVNAGAWFLEVRYNAGTDEWHPHLHVLITGKYIAHSELKQAWHEVTGDSFIVHITIVRSAKQAAQYVCKYASKPMDYSYVRHQDRLDEAIVAMHNRRLCGTFGDWRRLKLHETPSDETDWVYVGNLGRMLRDARRGNDQYHAIVCAIAQCYAADIGDLLEPPRDFPP